MAYQTIGLSAMQVYGKGNEVITLKERTKSQIYKYLRTYMSDDEIRQYSYVEGSQEVSENNGYTYAKFTKLYPTGNICETTLSIYNNPELD